MRRLLTILIALLLGSCQWIPVLAGHSRVGADTLNDSLTISAAWTDRVTIYGDGDTTSSAHRLVLGEQYLSPIGPWPCRWIRMERRVETECDCNLKTRYRVINGVAFPYREFCTAYHFRIEIDSIYHCEGDGVFEK